MRCCSPVHLGILTWDALRFFRAASEHSFPLAFYYVDVWRTYAELHKVNHLEVTEWSRFESIPDKILMPSLQAVSIHTGPGP